MTTLDIGIIIIGTLGTALIGSLAYKKWAGPIRQRRRRYAKVVDNATPPTSEDRPAPDTRPRRKKAMGGGGCLLLIILVLVVVVGGSIGFKYYWYEEKSSQQQVTPDFSYLDTIFVKVAREGKPAWVIMPRYWYIHWDEDDTKFSSHAFMDGENKVRIFITKPGVKSVEITIRRWYEPARR